jgi:endoglucanase
MSSFCTLSILLLPGLLHSGADGSPTVIHRGMVAPDILGITVQAGEIQYGEQIAYIPQPGDQAKKNGKDRSVMRNGKLLGWLVGKEGKLIYTPDRLVGAALDTKWADQSSNYQIESRDDAAYSRPIAPIEIYRKSKPSDFGRHDGWPYLAPIRHVLYLKLPTALTPGCHYKIIFSGGRLAEQTFVYRTESLRSEAIHVSHVGFRPDDPVKRGFLSCWLGSGGPMKYSAGQKFALLDETDGNVVFTGRTVLAKAGSSKDEDGYRKNYAAVDVFEMDFSSWSRPGVYRLRVEGLGCSYPFRIDDNAWRDAFVVSARGFYHQRSGLELGPPYTDFKRPRCFHPDDGMTIWHSDCPLLESGNGLNALGTDKGNFGNLNKGKSQRTVANAWGGYMDAGDWDRRIQHLIATRYLLELGGAFADYFQHLSLNIPESVNQLPDVLDEALFNLDCYRRMQTAQGGIRGGIESAEHPRHGEASWQESLDVMAYAPDVWSSYIYAGVAAQAAHVLRIHDPALAETYQASSLRAMNWAEAELARLQDAAVWQDYQERAKNQIRDERNLAAAELFRLTGDTTWHEIFKSTTKLRNVDVELAVWKSHDQREAAWVYLQTDNKQIDDQLLKVCRAATLREANDRVASTERSGFRYAKQSWVPGAWGAFTAPDAVSLVRAHQLTGDAQYLQAAILACQLGAGANPVNVCYTTGLGHDSPRHPLHIDSRITRQEPPPGLTVFGPADVELDKDNWAQKIVANYCHPDVAEWPSLEAFWDVFWYPSMCEFTVQQPMARNAYVWGYLAARPRRSLLSLEAEGFRSIFDGESLDLWDGDPTYWTVKDGILVGEVTPETLLQSNSWIVWRGGTVKDFELVLEYRVSAQGNSGIGYRLAEVQGQPHAVRGPQADIHGANMFTGICYEENGRRLLAARGQSTWIDDPGNRPRLKAQFGDPEELQGIVNKEDWNQYRLLVKGNRAQHFINGILVSEVHDHDETNRMKQGLIGVQVHVGPPMKIEYRNIFLKNLDAGRLGDARRGANSYVPGQLLELQHGTSFSHFVDQTAALTAPAPKKPMSGQNELRLVTRNLTMVRHDLTNVKLYGGSKPQLSREKELDLVVEADGFVVRIPGAGSRLIGQRLDRDYEVHLKWDDQKRQYQLIDVEPLDR